MKKLWTIILVSAIALSALSSCGYSSRDLDEAYDTGLEAGYKSGYESGYEAGISHVGSHEVNLFDAFENLKEGDIDAFNRESEYFEIWSKEDLQALFAYAMQRGYEVGISGNWDATAEEYINGYEVSSDGPRLAQSFEITDYRAMQSFSAPASFVPVVTPAPVTNPASSADYVLNLNSKKFHYPYCSSVDDMNEKNKYFFTGTREEVLSMGYVPCKRCNP